MVGAEGLFPEDGYFRPLTHRFGVEIRGEVDLTTEAEGLGKPTQARWIRPQTTCVALANNINRSNSRGRTRSYTSSNPSMGNLLQYCQIRSWCSVCDCVLLYSEAGPALPVVAICQLSSKKKDAILAVLARTLSCHSACIRPGVGLV